MGVAVGTGVRVAVAVDVADAVGVRVAMAEGVAVAVGVAVGEGAMLGVTVGVFGAVGVGSAVDVGGAVPVITITTGMGVLRAMRATLQTHLPDKQAPKRQTRVRANKPAKRRFWVELILVGRPPVSKELNGASTPANDVESPS